MRDGDSIRAVLLKEDDGWIGHCVDFDIVSHGRDADEAWQNLRMTIDMEVGYDFEAGREPLHGLAASPAWVLDRFNATQSRYIQKETRSTGAADAMPLSAANFPLKFETALCA